MTESDKANDWVRYFKIVPKLSTLRAVQRNEGRSVLEKVLKALGLGSASDVIDACKGDDW